MTIAQQRIQYDKEPHIIFAGRVAQVANRDMATRARHELEDAALLPRQSIDKTIKTMQMSLFNFRRFCIETGTDANWLLNIKFKEKPYKGDK